MNDEEIKDQQEQESNEGVSKVFGNNQEEQKPADQEADSKAKEKQKPAKPEQEGAESASNEDKQSKKTYTQEEVDAMMAKARKKYTGKGETTDPVTETPATEMENPPQAEQPSQDLATGLTIDKYAQAELKASMAIAGVDPQKVQRAVRLIDVNSVIENGQFSEEKANQEIEALLQDWPELKQAKEESNSNAFYFGAPEQSEQNQEEKQKNMFSSIFGNK